MTRSRLLASLSPCLFVLLGAGPAAGPLCGPNCCPPACPAPVLYTQVLAPEGTQATFIQGHDVRGFETPVTVGLRPGYVYRFRLSGFEKYPRESLWPTLEVIGTLTLPPPLCAKDHPTPVVFSQTDIDRAMNGAFITKVIYLENPDKALPLPTRPDQPLESDLPADRDPYTEAQLRGRPILVVRFGERQADPSEVAATAIPGTVLLPGDHDLGPPAAPPCMPFKCMQPCDPVAGCKIPEEECMHDGGDVGLRATIDAKGRLLGLDPTDTVAEYTDDCGKKHIAVSNRVCLCVPRFAVLRTEIAPSGYTEYLGPFISRVTQPPYLARLQLPPRVKELAQPPVEVRGKERPVVVQAGIAAVAVEELETPAVVLGAIGTEMVVGTLKQKCCIPAAPLKLCKDLDKKCAEIGEVVTFTLTYSNPGARPITDVVVSDSLTARLEYVEGSQKSERDATFTTQTNEVGSAIVRWAIRGTLQPGESGKVSFQVRIR